MGRSLISTQKVHTNSQVAQKLVYSFGGYGICQLHGAIPQNYPHQGHPLQRLLQKLKIKTMRNANNTFWPKPIIDCIPTFGPRCIKSLNMNIYH